ncbi:acetyl-CoA carboxylase biotin carboxyl carrier protein subunit [Coraliomargarita sinensis]|uniref:Acetyl-CoA carboxylase biotin carboxyl carrier protein subunit n=1 Tax=Coraliomargarita sinensis TaxID=2174842 RepID=A0A317ZF05_9BACT|nr:biotin/lipoyl-containing protein [Coraliomargarita sinensis]PXA04075.1 acetyl-CoA carboxylase biotin carboxyl carrier protein subunit [Coraliomargarita sinensis]
MKEYHLNVDGQDFVLSLKSLSGDRAEVEIDGKQYSVEIHSIRQMKSHERHPSTSSQSGASKPVAHPPSTPAMSGSVSADSVSAPIPGGILEIYVKVGETVTAGQDLLKMEAMKMENRITAPRAGNIAKLHVKAGDPVSQGQVLVELE